MFHNVSEGVYEGAAVGEQLIAIQWASANGCQKSNTAFYLSACAKSKKSIEALESVGHILSLNTSELAGENEDTEALEFLQQHTNCPMGKEALFAYAKKGDLKMILKLTENGNLVFGWKIVSIAVIHQHLEYCNTHRTTKSDFLLGEGAVDHKSHVKKPPG